MNLRSALRGAAVKWAERPALWVGGATLNYEALLRVGERVVSTIVPGLDNPVVAVIAERQVPFYCCAFGCLIGGAAYVPINPKWPIDRIARILQMTTPDAIIVDPPTCAALGTKLSALDVAPVWQVSLNAALDADIRPISKGVRSQPKAYDFGDLAYMMFTSGSTGIPKGVPITVANLAHYVNAMSDVIGLNEEDRVLQTVEVTFDLSVHDMMLSWVSGAMLAIVPEGSAPLGPRFVKQLGITSWLCVPSAAAQAKNLGLLKDGAMPSLKTSLFCGEALPASLAEVWLRAAPNARLLNIYGPTEATIAFSSFEVLRGQPQAHAVVPLGNPIGGQQMDVDDNGELLLGGPQLSPGYLADPTKTERAFVMRGGRRWYRTGDRAAFEPTVGYLFRGRMDSQVKLRGYRVELGEIEAALRRRFGTDLVAAVPIKETAPSTFEGVVGVICGADEGVDTAPAGLRPFLPEYMIPERIVAVERMPKNVNDKVDYIALRTMLEGKGD